CFDRLERPAEAMAAYQRYLAVAAADSRDANEARARVRALKERLPARDGRAAGATVPPPQTAGAALLTPPVFGGEAARPAATEPRRPRAEVDASVLRRIEHG